MNSGLSRARPVARHSVASRRWLRRGAFLAVVVGCAAGAGADRASGVAPGSGFDLVVDHQEALFDLSGLTPGPMGARYLQVEVRNGVSDTVVLSAIVGGTGLADYLEIAVEAGTVDDPATCAGFVGRSFFSGTLTSLGADHGDPTSGLRIPLVDQSHVVLRFSLTLRDDNRAQGQTATARFGFDAQDLSPAPAVPPTTIAQPVTTLIEPVPTTVASTTIASTTVETTIAPTSTTVEATSSTEPRSSRVNAPPAGVDGPGASSPQPATPMLIIDASEVDTSIVDRAAAVATEAARSVARVTGQAAVVTAKTGAVPGVFSSLVFGFLMLQTKVDRRDPKLASAPMSPEPDLEFLPRGTPIEGADLR